MTRGSRPDASKVQTEAPLIEYLVAHAGKIVTIDGIMKAMPKGALASSVRAAIRRLITSGKMEIQVITMGNAWRVPGQEDAQVVQPAPVVEPEPSPATPKRLGRFEQIGVTRDGSQVVRGPDNRLYRLTAL